MKKKDLVSVVITTKNEEDAISNLLESITKQTYKNIEIILVDNNSEDNTLKIARRFKKVKVYNWGPERSSQRNYGAKKSFGEYLLFLDADMKLSPKVVEVCVKITKSKKNIGSVVIPEQSEAYMFWEKVKAFERSFYNEKGDPITDAARFFKRSVFEKAGRYDETITGPEDWDLPETIRELGYKDGRISEKIYHRERATSLIALFKKKFYYGLYAHKYLRKHNIPIVSPKTVYFLRPLFYKSWKRLLSQPLLALGMIAMLITQTLGGGSGYLIGRIRKL
ncbi:glycosyltransferase [Candidatus Daviesbacteria bacterium]|nr:glycosyltransferase [Candidatus Daviesbacteria bacterium]